MSSATSRAWAGLWGLPVAAAPGRAGSGRSGRHSPPSLRGWHGPSSALPAALPVRPVPPVLSPRHRPPRWPRRAGAPQAEQRRGRGPAPSSGSPVQLSAALRGAGAAAGPAPCPGRQRAGQGRAGQGRTGQDSSAPAGPARLPSPVRPARQRDRGLMPIPASICVFHISLTSGGKKNFKCFSTREMSH